MHVSNWARKAKPLCVVVPDLAPVLYCERSQLRFARRKCTVVRCTCVCSPPWQQRFVIPLVMLSLLIMACLKERHLGTSCVCVHSWIARVYIKRKPLCTCIYPLFCIIMLDVVCQFLSRCKVSSVVHLKLLPCVKTPHSFWFLDFYLSFVRFASICRFWCSPVCMVRFFLLRDVRISRCVLRKCLCCIKFYEVAIQ